MATPITYTDYHNQSLRALDVDPAITALRYIADRFELNESQRHWISFLYGTCYCAPTVFYIYNEFPDFEMVDVNRLQRWWDANKHRLVFQTDRLRVKTADNFVPAFRSYRALVSKYPNGQAGYWGTAGNWQEAYRRVEAIKHFGRFSAFNYLDVLAHLTNSKYFPTFLNMREAESCRNGLCFALGHDDWAFKPLTKQRAKILHLGFKELLETHQGNVFQIETTLCAYKKYRLGKRYVGFYIERMRKEIETLEERVPEGVEWNVLWQFRNETFDKKHLREHDEES